VHPTVDAVVQKVLKDPTNRTVFGDIEAWMRLETGLQLFANLFFVFFVNPSTGHVKIRTIPFDEIAAVISNPDDAQDPWYYLRVWNTTTVNPSTGFPTVEPKKAYYPDWRYNPRGGHPSIHRWHPGPGGYPDLPCHRQPARRHAVWRLGTLRGL